ncbi:hypothetical protein ACE1CI_33315 [Aerosakkonemataceae cyanobacterium BLCC-F50]|uniref:Type I restriction enzyme R protein N-terminal domain-containing protein n=1 Tax=Floridaenema flaviceps BLCC-F50 TaxID=3153642 RepID=A0ABV4Y1F4_9CYAN
MKEKDIQEILEKLVQQDNFLKKIEGIDSVEQLYSSFNSSDYLPSFSIDYYSRKKIIAAAKNVIHNLYPIKIISTASKSISFDRKEKLFPDLVLFNENERKLIVLEIKRNNKTARETLTEMLAYDHEIRNFLPLIPNFDILYCIVSTDYSSLLNHSVAGLITWESKQILCLVIEESKEEVKLKIHFPTAWTSLGNSRFPLDAISTFQIILYNRDAKNLPDAESAAFAAASLIAKEGDRNNSHGFVFIWRDCWKNWGQGAAEFHLTVGFINPYVFLPLAQSQGYIDASQSPLGQYLLEKSKYSKHTDSFYSNEVLEKGLTFLNQYFRARIEGLSFWSQERLSYDVMLTMRHRALPLHINLWGALGDFGREFIIHPSAKKHILSRLYSQIIICEDPFVAIPIIDSISGIKQLDKRGLTCKVLFELGVSLGTLSSLYYTGSQDKDGNPKNLPASITWCTLDLQPILLELGRQYNLSRTLTIPPPTIKVTTNSDFENALLSVQALVDWIREEFLSNYSEMYDICFSLGLISHCLLDSYLACGVAPEQKIFIEEEIINISSSILITIVNVCLSDSLEEKIKQSILNKILLYYLDINDLNDLKKSLFDSIEQIPKEKHLQLYHSILINLISEIIPPINVNCLPSLNLSDYKEIDWIWIKEEILRWRKNGIWFPAVEVNDLGEVNIVKIHEEDWLNNQIDLTEEFILRICCNDIITYLVKKWKEIDL